MPRLTNTVATGPRPPVNLCFDHDPLSSAIRIGAQLHDLRLEEDGLFQFVEVLLRLGRNFDCQDIAPMIFQNELVVEEFLAYTGRIGVRNVDLVDGNHDGALPPALA